VIASRSPSTVQAEPAPVGDEASAVYALAVRAGRISTNAGQVARELGMPAAVAQAAIDALKSLHLLREHDESDRRWLIPMDPDVATAALISPIDREVQQRRAAMTHIRQQLGGFLTLYQQSRRADAVHPAIEELHEVDELNGHLYLAAQRCTAEFIAFRPNQGILSAGPAGDLLMPPAAEMLERRVRVRLLLQHAVRTDIRARAKLTRLIVGGAEVRTTAELSRHLMAFDHEVAFLLHAGDQRGTIGVMIRSPSAVRLLLDLVESTWGAASPYAAKEIGYHEVTDNLHRTIIQLLAQGLTDEAVARRLGVSVRTCRRHIANVLRDLDAVSRFQAGVRIGATSRQLRTAG
jgi:hypothetical protein